MASILFYTYDDNRFLRRFIRIVVMFAVLVSLAWFLVYAFMGQTIITGQSMYPALNSEDVCLYNRLKYDLFRPERFDIVLFERADNGKTNVKRVVGLPGEYLEIKYEGVYINGERLLDERIGQVSLAGAADGGILLGNNEYFVLGDNAESSEDSRFNNIGLVTLDSIIGKIWFRIRPLQDFGFIY